MRIEGANALVAGGASGLGAATARRLHAGGATRHDRRPQRREGRGAGGGARRRAFVACDVTEPEQVEAAVAAAGDDLRISVCCAGVGWAEKVAGKRGPHQFEPFRITVTVNLIGTFNVLRLAAAAMLANEPDDGGECGVIVNTASIAAYDGQIGQIAYAASKGGVVGMTLPGGARPRERARPRLHDRPRPLRHAAARRAAGGGARGARRPGPPPQPPRHARRVRRARGAHRREPGAQRRGHPVGRGAAHAAAVAGQAAGNEANGAGLGGECRLQPPRPPNPLLTSRR